MYTKKQQNTECSHQITLDAQHREDQRVFEHLAHLHVKGNQHHINVRTHNDVKNSQSCQDPEQHVQPKSTDCTRIVDDIKDQNNRQKRIKKAKQKALLEIALDAVEEVAKYENGVPTDKAA